MGACVRLIESIDRLLAFTLDVLIEAGAISLGVKLKRRSDAGLNQTLDERLAKIDHARDNLADALEAMDDLRRQAEENKHALEALNRAVQGATRERDAVTSELDTVRSLAALDTETVRRALGVPSPARVWAERLISFVLGVVASLVASAIWQLFA